jgi:hypothetical protein
MPIALTTSCAMSTEPSELPAARVEADSADPQVSFPRWVRRSVAAAAVVAGWVYIAWHNHFHIGPAVVILGLAWAACVSILYFLFRAGASTADPEVDREDWWLTGGETEELQREKRALLKSIREIEFDHLTGKLSDHDSQEMIQVLRGRAIEVLKALDVAEADGGARAEIEREVRARREIENARKAAKKAKGGKAASGKAVKKAAEVRAATTMTSASAAVDLEDPSSLASESAAAATGDDAEADDAGGEAASTTASNVAEAAGSSGAGSSSSEVSA